MVREGGGWWWAVEKEEGCWSMGVAGQQLLLSASIRKPRGDMGWRHGWGWGDGEGGEVRVGSQHPPNTPTPTKQAQAWGGVRRSAAPWATSFAKLPLSSFLHRPHPPSIPLSSVHNMCSFRVVQRLHFGFRLGGFLE